MSVREVVTSPVAALPVVEMETLRVCIRSLRGERGNIVFSYYVTSFYVIYAFGCHLLAFHEGHHAEIPSKKTQ